MIDNQSPELGNNGENPSKNDQVSKNKEFQDASTAPALYSQRMKDSQAMGLTHWMLYTDSEKIYAYDLVDGNKTAFPVLDSGLGGGKVLSMAVDSNQGLLFVAMNSKSGDKDTIDRFSFKVDSTS